MPTAFITGVAGGLGLTLAKILLQRGDTVYGCDLPGPGLNALRLQVPDIVAIAADVSVPGDVDAMFAEVRSREATIDILVNNVGIAGPHKLLEEVTLEEWHASLHANLTGAFLAMKHVLPAMKLRRQGAIVNVSTGSVRTVPAARSPYITSKGALEALTLAVAREAGPCGVRCNAVRPGMMDNARLSRVLARVAEQSGRTLEQVEEEQLRFVSTRSKVSMREVADLIAFLSTDEARNITGQIIAVDGNIEWEG